MRRHLMYLWYVLRHKWFVLLAGLSLHVPLWQLVIHDWHKFMPDEWLPYARCFYAPDGGKRYEPSPEFARAWMLHQHAGKHHWQWWLTVDGIPLPKTNMMVWDSGKLQEVLEHITGGDIWFQVRDTDGVISADEMPDRYRREMLADWMGAGKALGNPNTALWYVRNYEKIRLHPATRDWLDCALDVKFTEAELEKASLASEVESWPIETYQEAAYHLFRVNRGEPANG